MLLSTLPSTVRQQSAQQWRMCMMHGLAMREHETHSMCTPARMAFDLYNLPLSCMRTVSACARCGGRLHYQEVYPRHCRIGMRPRMQPPMSMQKLARGHLPKVLAQLDAVWLLSCTASMRAGSSSRPGEAASKPRTEACGRAGAGPGGQARPGQRGAVATGELWCLHGSRAEGRGVAGRSRCTKHSCLTSKLLAPACWPGSTWPCHERRWYLGFRGCG